MSEAELLQAAIIRHRVASPGGAPTPAAVRCLAIAYCFREAEYARRQSARRSGRATNDAPLTTAEAVDLLHRRPGRPKAGQLAMANPTADATDDDLLVAAMERHGVRLPEAGQPGAAEIRALAALLAKREARHLERERVRRLAQREVRREREKPENRGHSLAAAEVRRIKREVAKKSYSQPASPARSLSRNPGPPSKRDLTTVAVATSAGIDWATIQKQTIPVAEIASTIADAIQARDHTEDAQDQGTGVNREDGDVTPTYLEKSVRRIRKPAGN